MMLKATGTMRHTLGAAVITLTVASSAQAGPPLICQPFDAGASPLLLWGSGPGWQTPHPTYDVRQLTADTLRLLGPETPVLARMETMRRATIYASRDAHVAAELLSAILARAARAPRDPLATFDAGYLIESYRQARGIAGRDMLADIRQDGYALVRKAIAMKGDSADMEFAASLMAPREAAAAHRRRALAGASTGSLLARNLQKFTD